MASNVPLTIQTGSNVIIPSVIKIGNTSLSIPGNNRNVYWVVVLDRSDLSVKLNITFTTNNVIPPALQPFVGNSQYIMICTTQGLGTDHLPTGAFYTFLDDEGAGKELYRLEQIYEALNCGSWGSAGYALVTILDGTSSHEFGNIINPAMLTTLQLMPVQIGSQTLYTPVALRS